MSLYSVKFDFIALNTDILIDKISLLMAVGELQPDLLFTISEIGELRPYNILVVGELQPE